MKIELKPETLNRILTAQNNELTEYQIYKKLSKKTKDSHNSEILSRIAEDEIKHHNIFMEYTEKKGKADRFKVFFFYWISRLFGITFGIKLMEKGEEKAQVNYSSFKDEIPEIEQIISDEDRHEDELIAMIKEERLEYAGSVVLGLNDALVELTGTLAGLTFAFQNTRLIALAGLITGIAASFSMAASEYLSTKTDGGENALKSSIYTGIAYIITVFILIAPFLLLSSYMRALGMTLTAAVLIIFVFNYYISVAKDYNFKSRFLEMTLISLGVAALSFVIGYFIRLTLGIEV
jgi:VIT1/CCC1 family predicted Fe2+/Mn2+ transporter